MRLKKGKATYDLPSYYQIQSVSIKSRKIQIRLEHRLFDFGKATLTVGMPTSYSIAKNGSQIEFYPIPDKNYYVDILVCVMVKF